MKIPLLDSLLRNHDLDMLESEEGDPHKIILNEQTLKGFIATGKWAPLHETTHQFSEKPITELSNRTEAPNFDDMVRAHKLDGDISFAMDLHTAIIAGRGFHFKSANSNIGDKLHEFAKQFQLNDFLHTSVMESLGYGNSYFKYKEPDNFTDIQWMSISEMKAVWWSDNKIAKYEFAPFNLIPAEQILHLAWRRINASPFGFGLIEPLVNTRTYNIIRDDKNETKVRTAIMDIKPEMQDSGRKVLQRYIPRWWIQLQNKGPKDKIAEKFKSKLKKLEPQEDIIDPTGSNPVAMNQNIRAIDWESWEKLFRNEIITTLENPAIRIFTEPGFTKANADAAIDSVKMLLKGFASYLATQVDNVVMRPMYENDPWFDANGVKVPWKEAKAEFVWGPEETPDIELSDMIQLGNLSLNGVGLTNDEFRKELKSKFNFDIELNNQASNEMQIVDETTGKRYTIKK